MLEGTSTVIVAYSGGADSTALLHLFASHRQQLGVEVLAAHVNHGLREQSGQEAAHAARFCESLGVPLLRLEAKMNEQQKPQGLGTEAWARQIRYRWFDALAQQHHARVATGHTATDNVETMLFRMARGTGLAGFWGIPPVRGVYIRPLLVFTRAQIEQYCAENHLTSSAMSSDQWKTALDGAGLWPTADQTLKSTYYTAITLSGPVSGVCTVTLDGAEDYVVTK